MNDTLSPSDIALLNDRNNGFGDGGWLWLILIFAMMGGGFGRGNIPEGVTSSELQAVTTAQTQVNQLQQVALSSANNNYETAQLINNAMMTLSNQNNANTINVVQGFNSIQSTIANQTNVLAGKMDALTSQMEQCCSSIKTQMLQDRLSDAQATIVAQNAQLSNYNQSQYLLGQMGRWVGYAGSGAASTNG